MSIFSKLSQSRKAAKKHKLKAAEKEEEVAAAKISYRHLPTHAAVDALNGAPSTWNSSDRDKIREAHKRRSKIVAMTRLESSRSALSMMNYGASGSAQQQTISRTYSNLNNPAFFDRPEGFKGNSYYGVEPAQKRDKSRSQSYENAVHGPSPLSNSNSPDHSEEVSPLVSSGSSSSSGSSDHLQIATNARPKRKHSLPIPTYFAEKDVFDRLHTSTTRKLGEAPLYDHPPPTAFKQAAVAKVTQYPPKRMRWSLMGKKHSSTVAV
ncbi:hypothetical protein BJ878DRAFT_567234 [Calycina marina]|uniref:Uncharacterized protein n=1 Tax=Calycina marina TaxID=1763456 RepID=A0A9P8CFG8_9HELO|nr:hypothetical protein BJ878DRAFT_567234 [Calycina marina]